MAAAVPFRKRSSLVTPAILQTLLLLVVQPRRAEGHGFLLMPMSRNIQSYFYDPYTTKGYTPQGLNAGGPSAVSASGANAWPVGSHSPCGDAAADSPQRWMTPRANVTKYTAGQVVTLQVSITANHKGRFAFRLCTDAVPTNACFERPASYLTRADAVLPGDKYWYLTSALVAGGAGSYSQIAYPSPNGPDAFAGTPTFQLQFKLPAGVTCANCVLQWVYTTGNSCTPPCDPADPNYDPAHPTTGCDPTSLGICGTGAAYPEEFWNCADISIAAASTTPTTTSPTLPRPPPPRVAPSPPPPPPHTSPSLTSPPPPPRTAALPPPPPPTTTTRSPPPPPPLSTSASCSSATYLSSFCTSHPAGLYACPLDSTCATFINCASSGQGFLQTCSAGLRFSPTARYCDWPQNVQCPSGTTLASPPPPPSSAAKSPPPPPPKAVSPALPPPPPTKASSPPPPPPPKASSSPPPPPPLQKAVPPPPPASTTCKSFVGYWGQNSVSSWSKQYEGSLASFCSDATYDIIVVGFANVFADAGAGGGPSLNLANHCETTFAGSTLLFCPQVAADIQTCQSKGKKVLMSLGGAAGSYGFTSDAQAKAFAMVVWGMLLGGVSQGQRRPFGAAIMDGVDLDIEGGASTGYAAFITALRALYAASGRQYYISGAPQCVYPDAYLGPVQGTALQSAWFDFVFVQFYNNWCGVQNYGNANGAFNFAAWAAWAKTTSVNPNVKVFLGVPAAAGAAGSGYVTPAQVNSISDALAAQYPAQYGGVMVWDAGNSAANLVGGLPFGAVVAQHLHSRC